MHLDVLDLRNFYYRTQLGRAAQKAIRDQVLDSQRARRTLHAAMTGSGVSWDYQPVRDAANEYVRNHMDWAEAAARMRFPRFDAAVELTESDS